MLGLDPAQAFVQHLARIGHVQFADSPGRHEPGTGGLDFGGIFRTIRGSSYAGWVGAEYHPLAATDAGLGWMRQFGF
jgi:hydroxypyruvate isomerase